MPSDFKNTFLDQCEIKTADFAHKRKLSQAISHYNEAKEKSKKQFADLELARKIAKNKRWQALEKLDRRLEEFEQKITTNGGQIIWASNAQEANEAILAICKKNNCTSPLKSKNMVLNEIKLSEFLAEKGIETQVTHLGEYIQKLSKEESYHIYSPAIHKSKEEITKLFYKELSTEPNLTPEEVARLFRKKLSPQFDSATISISGANFLLADIGGVCISENEGNTNLANAQAPIQIVVAGIDKMLASVNDLTALWPLLGTYSSGKQTNVYNTIYTGPAHINEVDGPKEMYVILLDNGRTDLLQDPRLRESSYCIQCGSCANASEVYKNIGGHVYNSCYSGPIGAVINPHLHDFEEYIHLSHAETLDGNGAASCPVKIELDQLLQYNRTLELERETAEKEVRQSWKKWQKAMQNKGLLGTRNAAIKKVLVKHIVPERTYDTAPKKSFKQLYKEHIKKK